MPLKIQQDDYTFPSVTAVHIDILMYMKCASMFAVFLRIPSLGAFAKLGKATICFDMSVCPSAWKNSAPTGRIFIKFDI